MFDWALIVVLLYGLCLSFIFMYSLTQGHLALVYAKWRRGNDALQLPQMPEGEWPMVTVQLPVYNEHYVVERLLDAVAALDYPASQLEIQLLDDSDDDAFDLAAAKIEMLRQKGCVVQHIRRAERTGFKAGALAHGLMLSKGAFVAIFDADFVPSPDFLRMTIPYFFNSENLGVVQCRWAHLNVEYSFLTRLQAFGLNAHFTTEQTARNQKGYFINFNGTAGVWRKSCIEQSGGWQSDTLTEDLDLSYRAQLNAWRFVYLPQIGVPAELPVDMNGLKAQQYRWTKGAAQCAKKHLSTVLKKSDLPVSLRLHAAFHLLNSSVFVFVFVAALLSVPLLLVKATHAHWSGLFNWASLFLMSFLMLAFFYWVSRGSERRFWPFLFNFFFFLSVSMGLSWHNTVAVLSGLLGFKSPFVRTPKYALEVGQRGWRDKKYRSAKATSSVLIEALLSLYFAGGLVLGFVLHDFSLWPFHLMLSFGFAFVFYHAWRHSIS